MQSFLISIFGFWFQFRLIKKMGSHFNLSEREIGGILLSLLAIQILMQILLVNYIFAIMIGQTLLIVAILLGIFWFDHWAANAYRCSFLRILDETFINLRCGQGFRKAFCEAIQLQSPRIRRTFANLYQRAQLGQPTAEEKLKAIHEIYRDILSLESCRNRVLDMIEGMRRQKRSEDLFRRKSGQVTKQVRLQMSILFFMYLGLMVVVGYSFGIRQNLNAIMLSAALFLIGTLVGLVKWRNISWKV